MPLNTILITKSEKNIQVAELLIKENYPNESIHHAYYACYQLMMSILYTRKTELEEIKHQLETKSDKQTRGTHNLYINCFQQMLNKYFKLEKNKAYCISNTLRRLKRIRHTADYSEKDIIGIEESQSAMDTAKGLIQEIHTLIK